jgi:protein-S-isoprenylcysteine O-methyltransferase Ste14
MALIHSLENSGNHLFRYRGQLPVILFLLSVPAILFTDYSWIEAHPGLEKALLVFAVLTSFAGQVIRSIAIGTSNKYTSGRNTKEQVAEALNTKGIYSVVRHPLYLGNFFMWIGIVIYVYNSWFFLCVGLMFWLYYERIMFAEERFLERKFGQDYLDWSLKVPAFVPSFKHHIKSNIPFSLKTTFRREYSGITATVIGFVFVDFIRDWCTKGNVQWELSHGIWLISALLFSLVFRSLKHYTNVLKEEDRS